MTSSVVGARFASACNRQYRDFEVPRYQGPPSGVAVVGGVARAVGGVVNVVAGVGGAVGGVVNDIRSMVDGVDGVVGAVDVVWAMVKNVVSVLMGRVERRVVRGVRGVVCRVVRRIIGRMDGSMGSADIRPNEIGSRIVVEMNRK